MRVLVARTLVSLARRLLGQRPAMAAPAARNRGDRRRAWKKAWKMAGRQR